MGLVFINMDWSSGRGPEQIRVDIEFVDFPITLVFDLKLVIDNWAAAETVAETHDVTARLFTLYEMKIKQGGMVKIDGCATAKEQEQQCYSCLLHFIIEPTFRVWVEPTAQRAANTHQPVVRWRLVPSVAGNLIAHFLRTSSRGPRQFAPSSLS